MGFYGRTAATLYGLFLWPFDCKHELLFAHNEQKRKYKRTHRRKYTNNNNNTGHLRAKIPTDQQSQWQLALHAQTP